MAREHRVVVLMLLCVVGLVQCGEVHAQGRLVAEELVQVGVPGGGAVMISQPDLLAAAMRQDLIVNRAAPKLKGYRVRVYRGLGRNARERSVEIAKKMGEQYPSMKVYRSYQAPYYLTSVGNCRTRIDALSLQHRLLSEYPQAFVIEDDIELPELCVQEGLEVESQGESNREGVQ